jgi:hypothetical protein
MIKLVTDEIKENKKPNERNRLKTIFEPVIRLNMERIQSESSMFLTDLKSSSFSSPKAMSKQPSIPNSRPDMIPSYWREKDN